MVGKHKSSGDCLLLFSYCFLKKIDESGLGLSAVKLPRHFFTSG